ncbi:putative uncharacterized protein DDB_G0267716 [Mytilus edulis]|uniref:putative uncharacterized protein DDB_G0267716 n=1 Tax=Mytilus edulis TaxID=6550 RepID=UPI0039F03543
MSRSMTRQLSKALSTSSLVPTNSVTHNRPYHLNKQKALDKKHDNCHREHIKYEMKAGKNFVIIYSTAAYELAKTSIMDILNSKEFSDPYTIQTQTGIDNSNSIIDHCYKVFNRKNNGHPGNQLKFTINCYNSTNTMTVNGNHVDIFVSDILEILCNILKVNLKTLDVINQNISTQLNNQNIKENTVSRTSTTDQLAIKDNDLQEQQSDTTMSKSRQLLEYKDNNTNCIIDTNTTSNTNSDNSCICPICESDVTVEGIACDSCDQWFHFNCANILPSAADNIYKEIGFHCAQCNDQLLFDNIDIHETTPKHVHVDKNTSICPTQEHDKDLDTHETTPKHVDINMPNFPTKEQNSELENLRRSNIRVPQNPDTEILIQNVSSEPDIVPTILQDNITTGITFKPANTITPNTNVQNRKNIRKNQPKIEERNISNSQRARILSLENEIVQLKRVIETIQTTSTGTNNNIHVEAPNTNQGSNSITNNCQNNIPNQQYSSCNTCHHHSCNDRQQSSNLQQELMEQRLRSLENHISLSTALNLHISLQSRIVNQQTTQIPYVQPPQFQGHYAYPNQMGYNTHHPNNFNGGHMYQQGIPQFGHSIYNNPYYLNQGGMPHFSTLPNHNVNVSRHHIGQQVPTYHQVPTFGPPTYRPPTYQPPIYQHDQQTRPNHVNNQQRQSSSIVQPTTMRPTPQVSQNIQPMNKNACSSSINKANTSEQLTNSTTYLDQQEKQQTTILNHSSSTVEINIEHQTKNSEAEKIDHISHTQMEVPNIQDEIAKISQIQSHPFRQKGLKYKPPDNTTLLEEMMESGKRRSI